VGRPVILVSEPEAEAALTIAENRIGWVVPPGMPSELAEAILTASGLSDPTLAQRAVLVAQQYSRDRAMAHYARLIDELLKPSDEGA
jgi:hypothetical protein